MSKRHIGSSFDDFLREEGILAQTETAAIKRVLAYQIAQAMKEKGFTKAALAKTMGTSRAQLDRLLDPENPSVTLQTMGRAAHVLGKRLMVGMEESRKRRKAA
ncbi:MAG: helix-turn-helix domain-containing protein [Sulfuricaulis sp.]|nr:helix-turn-helix domain-containing protein [Sulfuricaulis sp.]